MWFAEVLEANMMTLLAILIFGSSFGVAAYAIVATMTPRPHESSVP